MCRPALLADGYDLMACGATLSALIAKPLFGLTVDEAGHIGSIALIGMLVGSLCADTLTEVVGRRRPFIASAAVFSAGAVASALVYDATLFMVTRVVTCGGVGGLLPTGPPIGMLLAACTAGVLLPSFGFRPVHAIAGIFLLLPLLMWARPESLTFLPRGRRVEAEQIGSRYGIGTGEVPAASVPRETGDRDRGAMCSPRHGTDLGGDVLQPAPHWSARA